MTHDTMPTITTADDNELEIELGVEEIKFIEALKALPDPRDNRGKRHLLAFLIVTVVFAILVDVLPIRLVKEKHFSCHSLPLDCPYNIAVQTVIGIFFCQSQQRITNFCMECGLICPVKYFTFFDNGHTIAIISN